eukprot:gb/GFBE01082798.1/.p1 GENE.gb/GFBE01082798.1/~~gb/GFBE01082798.1/.p1  ORF type:complete len:243 (+),score=34.71 gb/GFBE01082798.1/:1-729(+)
MVSRAARRGCAVLLSLLVELSTTSDAVVLLTGYNPWGNFTDNPSGEIASLLNGTSIESLPVLSFRVDVDEVGVQVAEQLVASGAWQAVVHLGFEDEAKGLKLETMASNQRALNAGPVDVLGPSLLPTTADLGAVALNTNNPHELWSRDAGTFFCNEIYYRTLRTIRNQRRERCPSALVPAIFIHIPPVNVLPLAESAQFVQSLIGDLVRGLDCPTASQEDSAAASPARQEGAGGHRWWHIYG